VPFPPDGIAFYSKNSAVSHLPFEPGGILTDSHASRSANSGLEFVRERRERFVFRIIFRRTR